MATEMTSKDWLGTARELSVTFGERAAQADETGTFVADNYVLLREAKLMSALVPAELGGGGASHRTMCAVLRELAHGCASTALSLSMHQHLVAAAVFNHLRGKPGKALLEKVVDGERVLVSTGARDWIGSNGSARKVDGGYRVSARKSFASGCPAGALAVTSAPHDAGGEVLHFAVPLSAEGVRIDEDWNTMGMRATGSHTMVFEDVFVPESAIALRRPAGEYPVAFNVILTVALPLISAIYVGNAEAAAEIARARLKGRGEGATPLLVGEMENALVTAQLALDSMVGLADDYAFTPDVATASAVLARKSIAVGNALRTTEKALEAIGGAGFYRGLGLERRIRDAHAGPFHPLPEKQQQQFTGRVALGLGPLG